MNLQNKLVNLQEVAPSLMTAVPRLYEVLHERIIRSVKSKGGISEILLLKRPPWS